MRRKLANAINPDKTSYPFIHLNWKSDEQQIKEGRDQAYEHFIKENGRNPYTDEEAITYWENHIDNLIAGVK